MTLQELIAQMRGNYVYAPELGATVQSGFDLSRVNPMFTVDDVGNRTDLGFGVDGRALYQDTSYDTGETRRDYASGVLGAGDARDSLSRNEALGTASYADRFFDSTFALIRKLDPSASEDEVFAAAQRVSAANEAPGKYTPQARVAQMVADNYLSTKLGRPVSIESIPGVKDWIAAEEKQASSTKTTWKEAAPYLMMFAAPMLGPALASAYGAAGLGATGSQIAAGATLGAANAGISGGDVLRGAALGGVSAGFADAAAPAIQSASQVGNFVGFTAEQAQAVARAAQAAGTAALRGGDPMNAAISSMAGFGAGQLAGGFTDSPIFIDAITNAASAAMAGQDPVTAALGGAARGFAQSGLTPSLNNASEFDAMAAAQPDSTADYQRNNMAFMPDILGDETGMEFNWSDWTSGYDLPGGLVEGIGGDVGGWTSGGDLPSGVYNVATGQFSPTPEGMEPGSYLQLPNGSIVSTGSLPGSSFNVGRNQTATQAYQNAIRGGSLTPGSNVAGGGGGGGAGGGGNNDQQRSLSAAEMAMLFGPSAAAIALATGMQSPDLSGLNEYKDISLTNPDTSSLEGLRDTISNRSLSLDNTNVNSILAQMQGGAPTLDTSRLSSANDNLSSALARADTSGLQSLLADARQQSALDFSGLQSALNQANQAVGTVDGSQLRGLAGQLATGSTPLDTSQMQALMSRMSQSTTPIDTARLRAISDQMNPNAVLAPFDLETGEKRSRLLNDQARRQIAGSSFGDQSVSSFDAMRAMARNKTLFDALTSQAGIEKEIADFAARSQELETSRGTAAGSIGASLLEAGLGERRIDLDRLRAAADAEGALYKGGIDQLGIEQQRVGNVVSAGRALADAQNTQAQNNNSRLATAANIAGDITNASVQQQTNDLRRLEALQTGAYNLASLDQQQGKLGLDYLRSAGDLANSINTNQINLFGAQNSADSNALRANESLLTAGNNANVNLLNASRIGLDATKTGLDATAAANKNKFDLYGRALDSLGRVGSAYLTRNNSALMPSLFGG